MCGRVPYDEAAILNDTLAHVKVRVYMINIIL